MTPETTTQIPGFTQEQSWAMNVVAERAAQKAIDSFCAGDRPHNCKRMDQVTAVVFGKTETGVVGLDQRMSVVEAAQANLRRIMWIAVGALVTASIGLGFALIQFALTGR